MKDRLTVLSMLKDQVIPPLGIMNTFSVVTKEASGLVRIFDFPYTYTHENLFPVNMPKKEREIDEAFHKVFRQASMQLF